MHSKESLKRCLLDMGMKDGETVLVHSSVKNIGEVLGKADAIIDSLIEYFRDGLVVMPTLSHSMVNTAHPRFSVRDTPSCVGALPEIFRKRPGVRRSLHPTHSVAAIGKDAAAFVEGHEKFNTPCARTSPWGRLVDRKAKILFVGTGICCNTLLHGVEEWMNVPDTLTEKEEPLLVIDENGTEIRVPSRRHIGARSQYYGKIEDELVAREAMKIVRFGEAKTHLTDVEKMVGIVETMLRKDINLFSDDRPVPENWFLNTDTQKINLA